jgi:hypothetical protein
MFEPGQEIKADRIRGARPYKDNRVISKACEKKLMPVTVGRWRAI